MEETKVEVNAVEEKPAKRTYNRQKKTETAVKSETAEVTKDTESIKVEVAEEKAETEVKVANEAKQEEVKAEEKKEEIKVEEPVEIPEEVKAEEPEKPAETLEEVKAVLSIEKPEIGSDEPDLKASYVIRKPVMIYFVPRVSERYKMFVGVVRVLDKVDDKFVKIAYRDSGTGKDITAYVLTSSLPQ